MISLNNCSVGQTVEIECVSGKRYMGRFSRQTPNWAQVDTDAARVEINLNSGETLVTPWEVCR